MEQGDTYAERLAAIRAMGEEALFRRHEAFGIRPISGGDGTDDNAGNVENPDPAKTDNPDPAKDGKPAGDKAGDKVKTFTQDELNTIVAERLERQKTSLTQTIRDQITNDLTRDKAEKDGDLAAVVASQKAELDKLRPLSGQVDKFTELSKLRYEHSVAQLPEAIRDLAPDTQDVIELEHWLVTKGMPAAEKLQSKEAGEKPPAKKGNNPNDPNPGGLTKEQRIDEIAKRYRTTGLYRPML